MKTCYGYSLETWALVAELDAGLTGDQEYVGLILPGLAIFFCGNWKYFLWRCLLLIQEGQFSVSG